MVTSVSIVDSRIGECNIHPNTDCTDHAKIYKTILVFLIMSNYCRL